MDVETRFLLDVIASITFKQENVPIPENINIKRLMTVAKNHSVTNILYYFLKLQSVSFGDEYDKRLSQLHAAAMYQEAQQEVETGILKQAFCENNIRYMLLKGMVIKDIYPKKDMRSMVDVDILIDSDNLEKAKAIMTKLGYTFVHHGDNHDIYNKKPSMEVELHHILIHRHANIGNYEYFGSWDRAVKKSKYEYEFTKEDYYVFMLGHMARHFYEGGCGIKFALDIWLYLKNFQNEMDFKYIDTELEKCGLGKFEKHIRQLCAIWFDNDESSQFYTDLSDFMISSGTHGSISNVVMHNIAVNYSDGAFKSEVKKQTFKTVFPDLSYMQRAYQFLDKKPYLLPACYIHRIFKTIFKNRKNIKKLSSSINIDQAETSSLKQLYNELGLK